MERERRGGGGGGKGEGGGGGGGEEEEEKGEEATGRVKVCMSGVWRELGTNAKECSNQMEAELPFTASSYCPCVSFYCLLHSNLSPL